MAKAAAEATEEDVTLTSSNIAVAMISLAMYYWAWISKDGHRTYQLYIQPYIVAVFGILWFMFIVYRVTQTCIAGDGGGCSD